MRLRSFTLGLLTASLIFSAWGRLPIAHGDTGFPLAGPTGASYLATTTFLTAQNAGTYTVLTASGAAVFVQDCTFYSSVASSGLVSMTMQTDDTTAVSVLASVLLAALTGGKNLTGYIGPLHLPSGKHIQATIVGTGSGTGAIIVTCRYIPLAGGLLS